MNGDLISREVAVELLRDKAQHYTVSMFATSGECHVARVVATEAAGEIANMPAAPITGDTSDGYHTFDELYHHRAVLFSVIVKAFPDKAWKARKHHDGSMYDGMFIVGIETPDGQATYHYDIDPYWDMFRCKELDNAPEWDEHTAADAIERIGKLEPVKYGEIVTTETQRFPSITATIKRCKTCGTEFVLLFRNALMGNYCPRCGARRKETDDAGRLARRAAAGSDRRRAGSDRR